MKDAMGELNMTVVVIVAIGAVAAFFTGVLWPNIKTKINSTWDNTEKSDNKGEFSNEGTEGGTIILPDYFNIPNIYE